MANLDNKVEGAIEVLKENGIDIQVNVKGGIIRSHYLEISTDLGSNSKFNDIDCAAEVEKAMRDALGYGTFDKSYDTRTKVMTATYKPLAKEASIVRTVSNAAKSAGDYVSECVSSTVKSAGSYAAAPVRKTERVRSGGCTEY